MVQFNHEMSYRNGQSFDTGQFVQNTSRWYPDIFSTDVVNKAASYFGGSSGHEGRTTFWA